MGENWDGSECKAPSTAGSLGVLGGLGSVEDVTSAIFAILSQPFKIYLAFLNSSKARCSLNFGCYTDGSYKAGLLAHTTNSYPTDKFTN
jgi:hypothetical protein